jgi:GntR family transcriptional repressor for pyruvate dehydrogenase complex
VIRQAQGEELIRELAAATHVACQQLTAPTLELLSGSVDRASSLPTRPGWEQKAEAHAEVFGLLGEIAGNRAAELPGGGADAIRDLLCAVGPAANGMIIGSRRRLLAHLRARNADAAEREMETHLGALHFMWRLACPADAGGTTSW